MKGSRNLRLGYVPPKVHRVVPTDHLSAYLLTSLIVHLLFHVVLTWCFEGSFFGGV
jgi:hypothetical protein